ncbi:UNVERIFIED_CONTAM: hypothetical protein HDU68_000412 [Siphonaria sp. JEL0065]|nr:hypothetical protein HDU68_000412 [Siphonaria sp. JEL0065]
MIAPLVLATFVVVANATPIRQEVQSKPNSIHHMTNSTTYKGLVGVAAVQAAATPHLDNYGGPVIANVEVQPLFYGSAAYQAETNAFYKGVTQSSWFDSMAQYGVGRGSSTNGIAAPTTLGTSGTIQDTAIQTYLVNLAKAGTIKPTVNTYFPIHFAPGITIDQGPDASGKPQLSCKIFCAYHGTIDISSLNLGPKYMYYGIMPDQGGACAGGCGSNSKPVNNMFSVASHELAEAVTDAGVGLATDYASPLAWYDKTNGENGDICNAQQGTTIGGDGVSYTIQKIWSNADNACVAGSTLIKTTSTTTTTTIAKPATSTTTTAIVVPTTTTSTTNTIAKPSSFTTTTTIPKPTSTTTTTTKVVVTTTAASTGFSEGAKCGSFGQWACSNSLICSYGAGGLVWVKVGTVARC